MYNSMRAEILGFVRESHMKGFDLCDVFPSNIYFSWELATILAKKKSFMAFFPSSKTFFR